ncbi:MAG: hypothetical protein Q4A23_01590 [bacterium]|nr:hypothetical protein [bacterium]
MNKDKFNPTGERHSAWGDVALQEEMLRQQQEELMRRQLELAQQKEDLSRYDDSQNKAFFDNINNIKEKFPELSVDHMENYAMEIRDKNSEISKLESLLEGNMSMTEYHQVKQRIEAARAIVESREKMLNALLNKKKENGYGGRADIIDSYIESIINGGKSVSEVESSKNDTDSKVDAEPEDTNDNINKQVAQSYKIDKENLEKLKNSKNHIKFSKENKAEFVSDGQSKLDEISDYFDKAVLNGASPDQLRGIAEMYFDELSEYRAKGETGDPDLYKRNTPRYKLMNDYISAIEKPERGEPNEINEDKDPSKLEKAKEYWGKLGKKIGRFLDEHPKTRKAIKIFLGSAVVGASFMIGRLTAGTNEYDSSSNNDPRTEHVTNDNQSNQDKSKYDSAIKDVLENNKDAEKNLEGYSADKDIYETEKPQKEYLENFSASREGLSTDDYRKFLANEVSTNPIMMLTKLDHAGLIPEFLDHDGDGDITDDQLHEIADKMTKDPALFKKVQDFYKKAVENAIIGEETEIPGIFDSEYIIKDSNGMQRLAHARDLRIGGKMRSIKLRSKNTDGSLKEGKSYDERTNCSQGVTVKTGHNFNSWAPRGCEIQITPNTPTPDKPNNPGEETPPPTPDKPKDLEKKDWSKQKAGDEVTPMDKGEFREDNSTRSSELDYTYKAAPQIGQETPNLGVDYGNTYNGQKADNQYNPNLEQQDAGVAGQSAEIDRQNQEAAARQAETDEVAENIQNPNRVTLADGTVIDLPPTN